MLRGSSTDDSTRGRHPAVASSRDSRASFRAVYRPEVVFGSVRENPWFVGIPANRHQNPRFGATSAPTTPQISIYDRIGGRRGFRGHSTMSLIGHRRALMHDDMTAFDAAIVARHLTAAPTRMRSPDRPSSTLTRFRPARFLRVVSRRGGRFRGVGSDVPGVLADRALAKLRAASRHGPPAPVFPRVSRVSLPRGATDSRLPARPQFIPLPTCTPSSRPGPFAPSAVSSGTSTRRRAAAMVRSM